MCQDILIRKGGDNGLLITLVPKDCNNVLFFVAITTLGIYWILIDWIIKMRVQTFQPLIVIYRRGNFDYHHLGCTSIYKPFFYLHSYSVFFKKESELARFRVTEPAKLNLLVKSNTVFFLAPRSPFWMSLQSISFGLI